MKSLLILLFRCWQKSEVFLCWVSDGHCCTEGRWCRRWSRLSRNNPKYRFHFSFHQ